MVIRYACPYPPSPAGCEVAGGGGGTVRSEWGTTKQGNVSQSTTRAHSLDQQQNDSA
jgi:hypothetical protein